MISNLLFIIFKKHSRWILEERVEILRIIKLFKCVILEQLKKVIISSNLEDISLKSITPHYPSNDEIQLKTALIIKLSSSSFKTMIIECNNSVKFEDKHKIHIKI